ncbi:MAG: hypothetical protein J0I34_04175 [Pseudonocardia sp.]|uniref:hypothetical protein n=1 Tax=unclassified Pseudonocardia TaxID=2619320 RepID=UPI001AD431F9|nr:MULTISPECIES: hypothetical protein [unclassified Pseudonocardia]MBN9107959.1 hypothetical protein [Pseudonocardia sp.]
MAGHPAPRSRRTEVVGTPSGMIQADAASERPGGGVLDDDVLPVQAPLMQQAVASGRYPHLAAVPAEPPWQPQRPAGPRRARPSASPPYV